MMAKIWVLVKHGLTKLKKSPYTTVYVWTTELIWMWWLNNCLYQQINAA